MAENARVVIDAGSPRAAPRLLVSLLLLAGLVAGLIGYKAHGGLQRIAELRATGSLRVSPEALHRPSGSEFIATGVQTLHYLKIVWPALLFGVLISAGVHATVSPRQLAALFGRGEVKPQVTAAAAGAPLMLCSCCVAPMFPAVYRRSGRLGPSLAFTLAAPSLNPAALALSFLIFPLGIAGARLIMAIVLVVIVSALVARVAGPIPVRAAAADDLPETGGSLGDILRTFLRSFAHITVRTVPWILLGIWVSMIVANHVPVEMFASGGPKVMVVMLVAAVALLLTLPTFFEIPLALSLLAAGASPGAAVAMLVAGPAINLASLLVIARHSHWKVAALIAAAVWTTAVAGGLLIG
ncbi:MAG: permease [Candidatus Acidiferrales bacterium]